MNFVEVNDRDTWDAYIAKNPRGHPLQLWGWGESKRGNGWRPVRLALVEGEVWMGAVQVLLWEIPRVGRYVAYVPRGPVVEPGGVVAQELLRLLPGWARGQKALYVRIEPAWLEGELNIAGWRRGKHQIQMAETYTIDLRQDETAMLEVMSRKHRQYVRKAERDGVGVKRLGVGELGKTLEMYEETARRADFGLHHKDYYQKLSVELGEHGYLYEAVYEDKPVAFLWLATAGKTAYELYGGVTEAGQEIKANYFLKWQAITDMKAAGFEIYDFNGRVTEGVSRFKEGFGPVETDWMGTWDYPLNRVGYAAWETLWPVAKKVGRRFKQI